MDANRLRALLDRIDQAHDAQADSWRASVTVSIAVITLLIDAGVVSIEEAAQRIEQIQGVLPETFQAQPVSDRIRFVTSFLRDHDKKPRQWRPEVIQGGSAHGDGDPSLPEKNDP